MNNYIETVKEILGTKNKFVIYNLILRNLKLRYRKSILGILWTVLIPACLAIIYYIVFQFVMRVPVPFYLFFILSGLTCWTFLSTALSLGLESIVVNHHILSKVPMPILVFPLSECLSAFLNLIFALPVLIIVGVLVGVPFNVYWLYFPVLLLLLFLTSYFISLTISIVFVYLRDLKQVMSVILQGWFYATPIIYDANMIPSKFQWVLYLNPVGILFRSIHKVLVYGETIDFFDLTIMLGWMFLTMSIAIFVYLTNKKFLIEKI